MNTKPLTAAVLAQNLVDLCAEHGANNSFLLHEVWPTNSRGGALTVARIATSESILVNDHLKPHNLRFRYQARSPDHPACIAVETIEPTQGEQHGD
jgi:hypothetical protein